ncbi:MAG: histidine kinase [Bacteroidetes bacterium]|nr:histidine kinase [Bacteroidota bacterium]
MTRKQRAYWICQAGGWAFYITLNFLFFRLSYHTNIKDLLNYILWLPIGIGLTHVFRFFIKKYNLTRLTLTAQIPLILFSCFVLAVLFFFLTIGMAMGLGLISYHINLVNSTRTILDVSVIFILWSIIYFGFHYLENYKQAEIQNLKLEANSKEVELNTLKSQLNPHFMFNSMNSIRALIDEDPVKAKAAVTQLSNILRSTLMIHKNRLVSLQEELALIEDYLELEHNRYEERLNYSFNIQPDTLKCQVPPMILQTLVENGIKHGISKQPRGGSISIHTSLSDQGILDIKIFNTGQVRNEQGGTGFGLINTRQRLHLLFGDNASFKVTNSDDHTVLSEIIIKT